MIEVWYKVRNKITGFTPFKIPTQVVVKFGSFFCKIKFKVSILRGIDFSEPISIPILVHTSYEHGINIFFSIRVLRQVPISLSLSLTFSSSLILLSFEEIGINSVLNFTNSVQIKERLSSLLSIFRKFQKLDKRNKIK